MLFDLLLETAHLWLIWITSGGGPYTVACFSLSRAVSMTSKIDHLTAQLGQARNDDRELFQQRGYM